MKTLHLKDCKRVFNRYDQNCPRCVELMNGSKPRAGWNDQKKKIEADTIKAIRSHDCQKSNCGPVCTAFDW